MRFLPSKVTRIVKYRLPIMHMESIMNKVEYNDIKDYVRYNTHSYQRVKLVSENNLNLYLLCWGPNQKTLIHDHPPQGCLLKVLKGNLIETTYYNGGITESNFLSVGNFAYREGSDILHKIVNSGDYGVTLHLYPDNYKPRFFQG